MESCIPSWASTVISDSVCVYPHVPPQLACEVGLVASQNGLRISCKHKSALFRLVCFDADGLDFGCISSTKAIYV